MRQPLVVIVDRHRQDALGMFLSDDVVVEHRIDLLRRAPIAARVRRGGRILLGDGVDAHLDAFVTNEHGRPSEQLADLVAAFAAERTEEVTL